jgi:hypothetical protein
MMMSDIKNQQMRNFAGGNQAWNHGEVISNIKTLKLTIPWSTKLNSMINENGDECKEQNYLNSDECRACDEKVRAMFLKSRSKC